MNALTTITAPSIITMSSRDIAELTGKAHFNVTRDIRTMLDDLYGVGVAIKFEGYYTAANGKKNLEYNLPKRETLILVSGYSVTLRARIIDRWQEGVLRRRRELEDQVAKSVVSLPDFSDPAAAARA